MQQHFYGHGKLMLTGEYFVLDGAKTLALPTNFGQHFSVKQLSGQSRMLFWVAFNSKHEPWLECSFDTSDFTPFQDNEKVHTLSQMLKECRRQNPNFLLTADDYAIQTQLEFPNDWGLGSSSTLVYCLSQFAGVNAYELLQKTMGGSGYDIACAGSDFPIIYTLHNNTPKVEQVAFHPSFSSHLFFVHLGKKQLSTSGIAHYKSRDINKAQYVKWLDVLTDSLLSCNSLEKCKQIMQEHEGYISEALGMPSIQQMLFAGMPVTAKSLGAWGGDFAMLAFEGSNAELIKLLQPTGLSTILTWDEMIFKP